MGEKVIYELLITQIVLILLFLFIVIFLIKARNNIKLQKKYARYTIKSINNTEKSFFDNFFEFNTKIIKLISKYLKKIKFFNKISLKYEKHIRFEELDSKDKIDYVSLKFLLGFIILILYFISQIIQSKPLSILGILISFIIGYFVLDIFIQIDYSNRKKRIEEDLLKAIIIMNNAFKSGRSTMQAIEIVKNELDGPISDEFKKIYVDINYGLSLEVVFDRFYNRVKLDDAKYITSSLTLLNKTGGNIVKVFSSIEKEFFSKKKLTNELKMMTSSSVFVFRVLLALPFVLAVIILILNKEYFNPLFYTSIGKVLIFIIIFLYILYILVVKKVLKVNM